MILTESVRDAADLYLSLKYPPVAFICDTPCTMVRHINNRAPDVANSLWGKFDGCFEEPTLDKEPRKVSFYWETGHKLKYSPNGPVLKLTVCSHLSIIIILKKWYDQLPTEINNIVLLHNFRLLTVNSEKI